MKARIRAKLQERWGALPDTSTHSHKVVAVAEEYFTPEEVSNRLKVHPDTVKALLKKETNGIVRIGNRISTRYKRRYVVERYSASAVERLIRRLEFEDPRYANTESLTPFLSTGTE